MNEAAAAAMNWWGMLTDPGYLRNPYPELKRLREKSPVHFDPYSGVYFVLGYREFTLMARAPEMGRDTRLWKNSWKTRRIGSAILSATNSSASSNDRW